MPSEMERGLSRNYRTGFDNTKFCGRSDRVGDWGRSVQSCNKKEMFKIKIKTKILGLKIKNKIKTSGFEIKIKIKIFTGQDQD